MQAQSITVKRQAGLTKSVRQFLADHPGKGFFFDDICSSLGVPASKRQQVSCALLSLTKSSKTSITKTAAPSKYNSSAKFLYSYGQLNSSVKPDVVIPAVKAAAGAAPTAAPPSQDIQVALSAFIEQQAEARAKVLAVELFNGLATSLFDSMLEDVKAATGDYLNRLSKIMSDHRKKVIE